MERLTKSPDSPALSVIIPVYNGARLIGETLRSVLAQRYDPIEIVVVDDGSTDGTLDVVSREAPGCICIRQENQGPPVARNAGIERATGEVIALLDADDLWPANKLALQMPHMAPDSEFDMVLGHTQHFRDHEATEDRPAWREFVQPYFIIQLGCALFRRSVFEAVGGFDPALTYSDDFDFLLRTREHEIPTAFVHETTILYRRHAGNMTQIEGHESPSLLRLMKRSLDRRRSMGIDQLDLSSWTRRE